MTSEPVDAVISWVDGNDKAHAEKLANYLAKLGISRPVTAAPTRFNECGEVSYCVKSLLRFAPWIRTIYIVTGGQTPPIIKQLVGTPYEGRVKLFDERDLFSGFESYLPVFNSMSIETLLWRIPELSNQFIYLNDDWFLIRPVSQEDFFRDNKLVLRGDWKVQSDKKWGAYWKKSLNFMLNKEIKSIEPDIYRTVQENSAKLVGWDKHFFHLPHAPLPAKKKTFENFFLGHPELLSQNISYPFRDRHQFLPLSLAYHLEIKQKKVIFDNSLKAAYVNGESHSMEKIQQRLRQADRKNNVAFVCMQSIDLAPEPLQRIMFDWLKKRIGS